MNRSTAETRLISCPNRPSCVCSLESRPRHRIEPFQLESPEEVSFAALRDLLSQEPRVEVVKSEADYLHCVFRTRLFRFADDVEMFRGAAGRVEVRSCSRKGYYDFGVNRRRIESLRLRLRSAGIIK